MHSTELHTPIWLRSSLSRGKRGRISADERREILFAPLQTDTWSRAADICGNPDASLVTIHSSDIIHMCEQQPMDIAEELLMSKHISGVVSGWNNIWVRVLYHRS